MQIVNISKQASLVDGTWWTRVGRIAEHPLHLILVPFGTHTFLRGVCRDATQSTRRSYIPIAGKETG